MPNELNSLDLVKTIEAEIIEARRLAVMPFAVDPDFVSEFLNTKLLNNWTSYIYDLDISSSYPYCQNLSLTRTVKLSKKHVRRSKRRAKAKAVRPLPTTISVRYAFLENVYPVSADITETNKSTGVVTLEATFDQAPSSILGL